MPCSFRDALEQAGFCCGSSGTSLQTAASCRSNNCPLPAIGLQQSSANKQYQILLFSERHNFSEVVIQRQTLLTQVVMESKSLQQFQQASSFQEGRPLMAAVSGAALPTSCAKTAGTPLLSEGVLQPQPARGTLGTRFLFWSFSSV